MPLNISALAPGPAGTTMLGERGGLEAAAQRGLERRQREREETAAREGKIMDDTMSDSGTTLVSENMKPDESEEDHDLVNPSSNLSSDKKHEVASFLNKSSQIEDEPVQKQSEGKWQRFKKHFQ